MIDASAVRYITLYMWRKHKYVIQTIHDAFLCSPSQFFNLYKGISLFYQKDDFSSFDFVNNCYIKPNLSPEVMPDNSVRKKVLEELKKFEALKGDFKPENFCFEKIIETYSPELFVFKKKEIKINIPKCNPIDIKKTNFVLKPIIDTKKDITIIKPRRKAAGLSAHDIITD
jgi:hypothetical protein